MLANQQNQNFSCTLAAQEDDFVTVNGLTLDFECFIEGAPPACVTINPINDNTHEGPEIFEVRVLEDPNFPDAMVFQNDLLLTITDDGKLQFEPFVHSLTSLMDTLICNSLLRQAKLIIINGRCP